MACYLVNAHKKGISSYQLGKDIGVAQKSAWFMLHRLREMMKPKEDTKLTGTVEVDEVYIGGRMKNKHKSVRAKHKEYNATHAGNKTGVMGLIERGKDLKVQVIDSNVATLKDMVRSNVATNSTIVTDALIAYRGLDKEFANHEIIYHDKDEFVRGYFHTNTIEGFFSFLKRSIYGIYHQVSAKHLQSYCYENGYRYNTRKLTDPERFNKSLGNMEGRLDYKTLTGKK
jgi:ISXO2-like transposase domain